MDQAILASAAQVDLYQTHGWLKVESLVRDDVLGRIRRVVLEADESHRFRVDTKRDVYRYRTEAQYELTFRLSTDVWRAYPELLQLAKDLAPFAAQLVGTDSLRLYADRLFIKPPASEGGQATQWHQDLPKLPFDRRDNVTLWLALEDIPEERGPLSFMTGSHSFGPLGAANFASDAELLSRLSPEEKKAEMVAVPLRAGDATFHAGLTLHKAEENRSERPRLVWSAQYIASDTLFTGVPHRGIEGLGLVPFTEFDHENFPVVI